MEPSGNSPFFTICIPVYNGEAFVRQAVDSVLRQTFEDWELIVVDDQSTDNSWQILRQNYAGHPKIRLVRNEKNLGMRGNFNRCIDEGSGAWLGILPQDDEYRLHALDTIQIQTQRRPEISHWMHAHFVTGENVTPNMCAVYTGQREFTAPQLAELLYLKGNVFGELSSYFIRRSAFSVKSLRFVDGSQSVDTRFWIRTLMANQANKGMYWPDALAHVWQHVRSGSSMNTASGVTYTDFFECAGDLAELGWSRRVLLLQMIRIAKCWLRFWPKLKGNTRLLPISTLGRLLVAFSRGGT